MHAITRLHNTPLWAVAHTLYGDPRRHYHTLDGHLGRMYQAWSAFGWAYCRDLDTAVLGHDIVLDPAGNNEARSTALIAAIDPASIAAQRLIMGTQHHVPVEGWGTGDWRLIALDLADFLNPQQTRTNSRLLLKEAKAMGQTGGDAAIVVRMSGYLSGLAERLAPMANNATTPFPAIQRAIIETANRLENGQVG